MKTIIPPNPDLTMDDNHVYRYRGRVVPSVTQVINAIMPQFQAGDWYLRRGQALHKACEFSDLGTLVEASVDDEIKPRVEAWRKFLRESGVTVVQCEIAMVHPIYMFAGTMDRLVIDDQCWRCLDIKSAISPQVIVQLGGYSLLTTHNGTRCKAALAVELRDNGTYSRLNIGRLDLAAAERAFLNVLGTFNFMTQHGLLRERK